jgi:hypothetical protein
MNSFIPEFVFGDEANGQYHKIKTSFIIYITLFIFRG